MTLTLTRPHAHTVLLHHLATIPPGALVTADTWRQATEPAQLKSAEIAAALVWAAQDDTGWLEKAWAVGPDGGTCPYTVPSHHPRNKGRRIAVYTRTRKATP